MNTIHKSNTILAMRTLASLQGATGYYLRKKVHKLPFRIFKHTILISFGPQVGEVCARYGFNSSGRYWSWFAMVKGY